MTFEIKKDVRGDRYGWDPRCPHLWTTEARPMVGGGGLFISSQCSLCGGISEHTHEPPSKRRSK